MNLVELLCLIVIIGIIAGFVSPWLPWPEWVSLLGTIVFCLGIWVFLRQLGRGKPQASDKDSETKGQT
jgi:protein-S-isoprenylcysteine O-methyltransferase Ste14